MRKKLSNLDWFVGSWTRLHDTRSRPDESDRMDLRFRPVSHTNDEIEMGHATWHYPVAECDAVSATANTNGFTPLTAIVRTLGLDREVIGQAAQKCNKKQEVCVVGTQPTLFLVPATKGIGNADFLIKDLIEATKIAEAKSLHMTHFGFMQSILPCSEVSSVLHYLFANSRSIHLSKLVIDIDHRVEDQLYGLLITGVRSGAEA